MSAGVPPSQVDATVIYGAVNQLIGEVAGLRAELRADDRRLTEHMAEDQRRLTDHDRDIRSLSRWRWTTAGGLAVVVTVVVPVVVRVIGG